MKRLSFYATSALLLLPQLAMAVDVHEPAPAGGEKVTPFAGTIAQSIAALLVFGVVFVVLRTKAWGPILKGLTDREAKIRGDLESAEAARREAAKALESYKAQIANADAEVRTKLATAQKDAEAIGTRLKMDAQKEIEEMKTRANREIEETKNAALVEVRQQAASISTAIAGKILKRNINEADQADLIRSSLEELQVAGRR
jgi:F-type H+-transporting ATPase subunit b